MKNNAIIVRNLHTTNELGHTNIRFERMSDMVLHEVNGRSYFSNGKYLAAKGDYTGEILEDCRVDFSDAYTKILELDGDYDVEVTTITLTLRHEKVIPK